MRKTGGLLAFFCGLYGALAAIVTLFVLGGFSGGASVDPVGVAIGWAGLALSFLISGLGMMCLLTEGQRPLIGLLLTALAGFFISETLVSICMLAAFLSGVLASYRSLPSLTKHGLGRLARIKQHQDREAAAIPVSDQPTAS